LDWKSGGEFSASDLLCYDTLLPCLSFPSCKTHYMVLALLQSHRLLLFTAWQLRTAALGHHTLPGSRHLYFPQPPLVTATSLTSLTQFPGPMLPTSFGYRNTKNRWEPSIL